MRTRVLDATAGIVEALAKAGKTDEAQQVAGEALETARMIPDADLSLSNDG